MITMLVNYDIVRKEYEKESNDLITLLRNSNSKNKDIEIEKINWIYSFSYFVKKGENTEDYYEQLVKLPYDERLSVELKKVRVNLSLYAGHFYISDRVEGVSEIVKKVVEKITVKKMTNEAETLGDDSLLGTIPMDESEKPAPMSLQDQLKQAIELEDYMEAARIRDEIRKSQDES